MTWVFYFFPQTLIFNPNPVLLVKDVCTVAFIFRHCLFEYLTIKTDLKFHKSTSCSELAVPKKRKKKSDKEHHTGWHCCQKSTSAKFVLVKPKSWPLEQHFKRRQTGEETKRKTWSNRDLGKHVSPQEIAGPGMMRPGEIRASSGILKGS